MRIETLSPKYFGAYRALRLRALREEPHAFQSSFEQEAAKSDAEWKRERLQSPHITMFCALEQDEVLGTCGCRFEERVKVRHKAMLIAVYVAPEARGRGLARSLSEVALGHAFGRDEIEAVHLTVTGGNDPALRLYESLGFESWGEEPAAMRLDDRYVSKIHMELPRSRWKPAPV
ncbi:hypothetical protein ABI59_13720 [Acidobacteria bacterium Mor1]|nr:hypothetical protein ABI59_13720 [Acidobacteria bacterium Mor1]